MTHLYLARDKKPSVSWRGSINLFLGKPQLISGTYWVPKHRHISEFHTDFGLGLRPGECVRVKPVRVRRGKKSKNL